MTPTIPPTRPSHELVPLLAAMTIAILLLFLGGAAQVVILSLLLAYILDPAATALEARGMSRTLAVVLVVLTLTLVIGGTAYLLVPAIMDQMGALQSGATTEQAAEAIRGIERSLKTSFAFLGLEDLDLLGRIATIKQSIAERVFSFLLSDSLSLIVNAVTIPFLMFFFLKDGREMKKKLVSMVPNRYFEFTLDLLYKMDMQLGNYLRGQFVDAVAFGLMSILALWILGVNYFVFLGVFAGLANLIPYVGPIAGVIPAAIVAVLGSGDLNSATPVIIAYFILKLLDDFVVAPTIVASSVEMHPVLVLIAIMIGGELFGILGMLLAVPVAGFFKVVLQEGVSTYRKYRFN
ncbi:MAG: AI-2E family transporter [Ignavibacteriae bacterium]|nr:AI-2E family transporter [Ignavibacteriota bacterium]